MSTIAIEPSRACELSPCPELSAHFELNRTLDRHRLNRLWRQYGRLQIPEILSPKGAQVVYECLAGNSKWGLMLGGGPGIGRRYATAEQCAGFTPTQLHTLHAMAHAFRGTPGAHLHEVRPIATDEYDRASDPSLLARFVDFANTTVFLDFARELTGAIDICQVNAQATCFRPGHFFDFHTDAEVDDQQRATAIFYFTPRWQYDWGGLLQFRNERQEIVETFVPTFNSLAIFSCQQDHAVSAVGPTCRAPRFAIAAAIMAN